MKKTSSSQSRMKRRTSSRPTAERVRELFHYEIVTGRIYRKVDVPGRWGAPVAKAGDLVGTLRPDGYSVFSVDYRLCRAHHIAYLWVTGEWPTEIDHINHTPSCNAWHNLREATRSQNTHNTRAPVTNTSGVKGVCWDAGKGKWLARVWVSNKAKHIGRFDTLEEASVAVRTAREKLHGEFARH